MPAEAPRPTVGLFVTCLVDLFRPSVGFAAVKLLEARRLHGRGAGGADLLRPAGLQLRRPRATRAPSPAQVIAAFEGYDYVVAPSGSCAGMLKHPLPGAVRRRAGDGRARAEALAGARSTSWSASWSTCAA